MSRFSTLPALFTMPEHCGTLAAVRVLGEHGIEAWTAGATRTALASHSRYAKARYRCPPVEDAARFVAWLRAFGERHPGAVLYPTSDDTAWLQAAHAKELERGFRLYAPPVDVIETLLDKRRLHEACDALGIATPRTYYPESDADLRAVAATGSFPVLLKLRTQVLSATHSKGVLVSTASELGDRFRAFALANGAANGLQGRLLEGRRPMIQAYHPEGISESYLVSGFIDRDGESVVMRAARKVLQRPRTLGIALCLEPAPVDPVVATQLVALCRRVGYFGVFQTEFLRVGGRYLLIDFNPRYYHYLAFDIARGMPLPLLVHHAASGDAGALARAVAEARDEGGRTMAFSYRLHLRELLVAQVVAGTMSMRDAAKWRAWYRDAQPNMVDAVSFPGDPLPAMIDAASLLAHRARHPRSFLWQIALDR